MKVSTIQTKNGIIKNVGMSLKHQMNGVLVKINIGGILVRVIVSVIKHIKLINIQILNSYKNICCKLVLTCEYGLINTTETSFINKK